MNSQTGATGGNTQPLNWGSTNSDTDNIRTTKSATFVTGGKEYTVTVSYNRAAVMAKYNVDDSQVDQTMEQVISRIGQEQLSKLSGHCISTSLRDPVNQARFKKIGDNTYQNMPQTIPADSTGDIFRTINTVTSVFNQSFPNVLGSNQRRDDDDVDDEREELDITVENMHLNVPEGGRPIVGFREEIREDDRRSEGVGFESEGTVEEVEAILEEASKIQDELSSNSPLKRVGLERLKVLARANIDYKAGAEIDLSKADTRKANIVALLKDTTLNLSKENQHEALNQLDDQDFANAIRVELY